MEDSIKTASVGKQIKRLFLLCGFKFDYGSEKILNETKETARIYTDALKDINHSGIRLYSDEIVKEAIKRSVKRCDHLSNPLPKLPMILDICDKLVKYGLKPKPEPKEDPGEYVTQTAEETLAYWKKLADEGNGFAISHYGFLKSKVRDL